MTRFATGLTTGLTTGLAAATLLPLVAIGSAHAQTRSVFPDDSIAARDALVRVGELHAAGNTGEAVRVLQNVLDVDPERLLPRQDDPDVLRTVRDAVHELLRSTPPLLERYMADEGPVAASLLAANELVRLERSMLFTPSGFEAALRLAQQELEQARFESARLMLEQLDEHPLRKEKLAADAASVAWVLEGYLPSVRPMAQRWATTAGVTNGPVPDRTVPPTAGRIGRSPLERVPVPRGDESIINPLQSAGFEPETSTPRSDLMGDMIDPRVSGDAGAWVFPTIEGGRVFATDGLRLCAWDASTLTPLWVQSPTGKSLTEVLGSDDSFRMGLATGRGTVEDPTSVSIAQGVAVFTGGIAFNGTRLGDNRLHAVNAATGELLWSTDIGLIESRRLGGRENNSTIAIRGNVIIEGDTVVAAVRRAGQLRRITSLYLVGIDLHTGSVKWTRLVGGYGTNPWGRTTARPEGIVADRGVVYRADDMGVIGAYEIATGRPRWVRLLPTRASLDYMLRNDQEAPSHAMHVPVVRDDSLFLIEPELVNAAGRVIELSKADGLLRNSRDGSALANPQYLIAAGDYMGAVSAGRIAFVKFASLRDGTVQLSDSYASPNVAGRAVVAADGSVLLPLADAIARIDPADPAAAVRRPVSMSGNVIVADREEGGGEHLLVADDGGLHTYLDWKRAQALLERRIKASPKDTAPILTYVDLAGRVGRAEMVAPLCDTALALIDSNPDAAAASAARGRLFGLLEQTVSHSRREWTALGDTPGDEPRSTFSRPPVRDPAVLDELIARMERASESPAQTCTALFEKAWLRGVQNRYPEAVEAYQAVLLDSSLGDVMLTPEPSSLDPAKPLEDIPAGAERAELTAKDRLLSLLRSQGPTIYAAFDAECAREAAGLPGESTAAEYERLARRYPAAADTASLWARAGRWHLGAGNRAAARKALGSGVAAAELSASIGRPNQGEVLGSLAGQLVAISTGSNEAEPVYRLLMRLARDYPSARFDTSVTFSATAATSSPQELAAGIAATLALRTKLPNVGERCDGATQVLGAWEPLDPISKHLPGTSGDGLIMYHRGMGHVGYWAVDALDGQLHLIWSRRFETRPTVVRVTPQATWFFWPTTAGGVLESVANAGGRMQVGSSLWKTQDTGLLFPPMMPDESTDRFTTPTDGQVRPDDVMVVCDVDHIAVIQRRGGAACIEGATGKVIWNKMLDIGRVFEAELAGPFLLAAGTYLNNGEGRYMPLVVTHRREDGAQGPRLTAAQLGDHPRWLRGLENGQVLVGAAAGLLKFDPSTGAIAWSIPGEPARSSLGAWMVGDKAFVLTNESQLWRLDTTTGTFDPAPTRTRERLHFPMAARVNGDRLVISSSKGLAIVNGEGVLLGTDGLDGVPSVEAPEVGDQVAYAVESDPFGSDERDPSLRIFCFEQPSARLLSIQRVRVGSSPGGLTLIDGKLIIPCGALTLVIDAPAP